jgi:hypothetical protein
VTVTRPARARTFTYVDVDVDPGRRSITCAYTSDGDAFVETATFGDGVDLAAAGVDRLAELYFVLAGLSYYKTGAAESVEAPRLALGTRGRALLAASITGGLAEFAHRNGLDLDDVALPDPGTPRRTLAEQSTHGPLIPFGGGIDSIVTVETTRGADAELFVVEPSTGSFAAIERPAARTGLAMVRCTRALDPSLGHPRAEWFNGHVPVTAIVSALALVAAVGTGHDAVLMSNERSASSPSLIDGRLVNHQWSKSLECELLLRAAVAERLDRGPDYRSELRERSELWVAREFSTHPSYLDDFMSCNRAFRQEVTDRATTWCGQCDKCLFTDLVLAPFVDRAALEGVFSGSEPLADPTRIGELEVLVGLIEHPKPFECVGDVDECGAALVATAARPDRADQPHLAALAARCTAPPIEALLKLGTDADAEGRHATPDLL